VAEGSRVDQQPGAGGLDQQAGVADMGDLHGSNPTTSGATRRPVGSTRLILPEAPA
jgi:hypothetical protein